MAKQTIQLGTVANDGTGDPLRTAFTKTNSNFTELYTSVAALQSSDADLTAIAALSGTSGLLRKTNTNTWTLDTANYLTSINSIQIFDALGYTPYNGTTNSNGYLTGVTSAQIINALGYTPYSAANPTGYITSAQNSLPVQTGNAGKILTTNGTSANWSLYTFPTSYGAAGQVLADNGSGVLNWLTITLDPDVVAIGALTGTSGFLKKTGANTWTLDTNTYATLTDAETLTNKTAGIATTSSTASSLGYLGIPQNSKSSAYTTVIGDAGKHIYVTSTATITIDSNTNVAYPIGTTIGFIAGAGATVTIAITSDTMYLGGTGTTGSRTLAAFGMATAIKVASNTWYISGNGLT